MDSNIDNFPTFFQGSMSLFEDFQSNETTEDWPSDSFSAPTTFSSGVDGRYQLNDIEYINPTFLDSQNPDGTSDFFDSYFLPATQNIQNELSAFHPEHFTDLEFGQQQILQPQQGGPEFTVPNAPDTSADDYMSLHWSDGQRSSLATLHDVEDEPTAGHSSEQGEKLR
jgi:hypothetical protein